MNLPETLVEDNTREDALFPEIDRMKDGDVFVELGTFLGGNIARCVLYAKQKNKNIKFFVVDNFIFENISTEGKKLIQEECYLTAFLNGMKKCGILNDIEYIQGNTTDKNIVNKFKDYSISCLFTDDGHQYPHTKNVLDLWIPKVKSGGLICGHDWSCEGVDLAIKECLNDEYISNGHSY